MAKLSQAHPPPQGSLAHYRETQVHRGEGVGHDDLPGSVQDQMAVSGKDLERVLNLGAVERTSSLDRLPARGAACRSKRLVDESSHRLSILRCHGNSRSHC